MRIFQQSTTKTFLAEGIRGDDAADKAIERINDHQGGDFPTGNHIIPDADLVIHPRVDDSLVQSLVVSADEHQFLFVAQFFRIFLVEHLS